MSTAPVIMRAESDASSTAALAVSAVVGERFSIVLCAGVSVICSGSAPLAALANSSPVSWIVRESGFAAVHSYDTALSSKWAARRREANVLDPGMVKNQMGEQFERPAPTRILMSHIIPFFAAAGMERGSQQYVRLAADPALVSVSGMCFVSGKENKQASSPLSLDPAVQKRIDVAAEAWAAPFLLAR